MPPTDVDLIGLTTTVKSLPQDTLLDIARQFDLGQQEILLANPNVDRWLSGRSTEVVLPGEYILPRAERKGVVLNLPEMRFYYFYEDDLEEKPMVKTYPVSVGRMDWETPLGKARIVRKDLDPSWFPPESLKLEAIAAGEPLPDVVPPGPDNPLGGYVRLAYSDTKNPAIHINTRGEDRLSFFLLENEKSIKGSIVRYPGNAEMPQGGLVVALPPVGGRAVTPYGNLRESEH